MRPAVSLREWQDGFASTLIASDSSAQIAPAIAALVEQPGFTVYRNTVMQGCVDALRANYPAVERLVGSEWFDAAAAVYVRAELPTHPALVAFGVGFAEFLRTFAPAAELPYLTGVARLDRFWTEAHIARDEPSLQPATAAYIDVERAALRPHASARWRWFDDMPIFTIWQRNRDATFDHAGAPEIVWRGEGALIARPHGAVQSTIIGAAACALLDTCAAGRPLAEAVDAALATDASIDAARVLLTLLAAGAFAEPDDYFRGTADADHH